MKYKVTEFTRQVEFKFPKKKFRETEQWNHRGPKPIALIKK